MDSIHLVNSAICGLAKAAAEYILCCNTLKLLKQIEKLITSVKFRLIITNISQSLIKGFLKTSWGGFAISRIYGYSWNDPDSGVSEHL